MIHRVPWIQRIALLLSLCLICVHQLVLPADAANQITLTRVLPSPLTRLATGYAEVKVADISITNDQARTGFTLTVSAADPAVYQMHRKGGNQRTGDLLDFALTLKEGSGLLGSTVKVVTPMPALGTYQSFRLGDLRMDFIVSGPGIHARDKIYELWLRTPPASHLFAGDFTVAIHATLSDE